MKKLNPFNLVKSVIIVLVIALASNTLASSEEVNLATIPTEGIPVVGTEYSNTPVVSVPTPYATDLDGEVIEFESTQEWFDSYAPKSTPELEPTIDTSQQTPNTTLSNDKPDLYRLVIGGATYVLTEYVNVNTGKILKDGVHFVGEQLGIETPDITTIDGLFNFVGEMVSKKVTEFLTYIFDAIWNGIESLF